MKPRSPPLHAVASGQRPAELPNEAESLSSRPGRLGGALSGESVLAIMEVHSGLSARIADAAGFEAMWASGLAISSLLGLRDSNEASWTQMLSVVEWITDATERPVLVDGDSGHGNFNNARRFARKLFERRAAGVCFEDKLFPKTNSFVGHQQKLAGVDEFCGRIKASKDTLSGADFSIVARTEALVSGHSLSEALDRAEAYTCAGADAVLVHSKSSTPDQVFEFARQWSARSPLILVPTTYPHVTIEQLQAAGIAGVIWANHSLRSSAQAMMDTCRQIRANGNPIALTNNLASIDDLFDLLDYRELAEAERRYLGPEAGS